VVEHAARHHVGVSVARLLRIPADVDDFLGANEVWKRTLLLQLRTPQLLRKADNRHQRDRLAATLADVRAQAQEQMRRYRRRPFRGDVSVALTVFAPRLDAPPSSATTVKAYLDALNKIAWRDDRQVAHLTVHRHATDHPWARRARAGDSQPARVPAVVDDEPWVGVEVCPLRVYTQQYDRMFRLRDEVERRHGPTGRAMPLFEDEDDGDDQVDLSHLLDERADDLARRGVYGLDDEVGASMRAFREEQIRDHQLKMVLWERPGPLDRPGPPPPHLSEAFATEHGFPWIGETRQVDLPGALRLALPAARAGEQQGKWRFRVREAMEAHARRWPPLPTDVDVPLALNVAVTGMGDTNRKDIDNLAHDVLIPFEAVFCGGRNGTVTSYRVYRAEGRTPGVRVTLMAQDRLDQLQTALDETRDHLMRRGPDRDRW
jgi:Holliday junction resolvase RusA-like endonuclease